MSLKIAKVVYEATKSLMSNPIAKTVGIGAIFGAGVLLGNQVGLDSFERKQQTEVVDSTSTSQNNEVVKNTNTVTTVEEKKNEEEKSNKVKELRKVIEELDNLPIGNVHTKTKVYTESYGDSQYMHAGKYTVTEGTVNYKGKSFIVEINEYGEKKFYGDNGNLVYFISRDRFKLNKYDENNHLIESVGGGALGGYYYNKNDILNKEAKEKENEKLLQLNKFTEIQYDANKESGTVTITDENGHLVKSVFLMKKFNDKINIKNGKIIDINGRKLIYDNEGRLIEDKTENKEIYTYDVNGNIKEVIVGCTGIKYTFEYDKQNTLIDFKEENF